MVPAGSICKALSWSRACLGDRSDLPWIVLTVRGFKDSPLSFLPSMKPIEDGQRIDFFDKCASGSTDHSVDDMGGENDYSVFILQGQPPQICLFVAAGAGDGFRSVS